MHARVGDRLLVPGNKVGDGERVGEVLEVRGPDGTPPFVVRWQADGHEALFVPGPEAVVQAQAGTGRDP